MSSAADARENEELLPLTDALALARGDYWTGWRDVRLILLHHDEDCLLHILPRDVLQKSTVRPSTPRVPKFELNEFDLERDIENYADEALFDGGRTADDIRQMVRVEDGGSRLCSFQGSAARKLRIPWSVGFQYFELRMFAWAGTSVQFDDNTLRIDCQLDDEFYMVRLNDTHVGAWPAGLVEKGDHTSSLVDFITFGFLFNFDAGYVLF